MITGVRRDMRYDMRRDTSIVRGDAVMGGCCYYQGELNMDGEEEDIIKPP